MNFNFTVNKNKIFILLSFIICLFSFSSSLSLYQYAIFYIIVLINIILYSLCVIIKPSLWLLIPPLFAVSCSLVCNSDPIYAILSLTFAPVGLMIGNSILQKNSRTQTVVRSSFALLIMFIMTFLAIIIRTVGLLSYDDIDIYVNQLSQYYVDYLNSIPTTSQTTQNINAIFNNMVFYLKTISFASLIVLCQVVMFFCTFLIKKILQFLKYDIELFKLNPKWELELSKISALVFLISTIIMFFANENVGIMFGVYTLYLPISFGLVAVGLNYINKRYRIKTISIVIIIIIVGLFIPILISLAFIVLSSFGLLSTFLPKRKNDISNSNS